jgi:nitrate/nitrite transporter NarK
MPAFLPRQGAAFQFYKLRDMHNLTPTARGAVFRVRTTALVRHLGGKKWLFVGESAPFWWSKVAVFLYNRAKLLSFLCLRVFFAMIGSRSGSSPLLHILAVITGHPHLILRIRQEENGFWRH